MKLLKFVALPVAVAGVVALALVYAPVVAGQRGAPGVPHELPTGPVEIGAFVRDSDAGVVVEDVRPDGPAARAGLKRGDVVTMFDGDRVRSARQFTRLVAESAPDRTIGATVRRDGKSAELKIAPARDDFPFDAERLRDRIGDAQDLIARLPFELDWSPARGRLGVTVQELTPQLQSYFGSDGGVLVASVADDTPASRAGLKAGDVITAVDGKALRTQADLRRALRDAEGEVTLKIVRDRKEMTLKATIEGHSRTTRR